MAKRPIPTKALIQALLGDNQVLHERTHHGLAEVGLSGIYPVLNLDEVITFAAASGVLRDQEQYRQGVQGMNLYEIFKHTYGQRLNVEAFRRIERYGNAWQWLNSKNKMDDNDVDLKLQKKYGRMNPQKGNLAQRLGSIDEETVDALKARLLESPCEWVFQCQYDKRKRERGGDNHKLNPMDFQKVFPRKGKIVPKYAAEISRLIGKYPTNIVEDFAKVVEPAKDPMESYDFTAPVSPAVQETFFDMSPEHPFFDH